MLQSARQFSNWTRNPRGFSNWNETERRPWTKEELDSMHVPIRLLPMNVGPTVWRLREFEKPPTKEERRQYKRREFVRECFYLLASIIILYYYYEYKLRRKSRVFDPPKFTPFSIVGKEEVSPTSFIITLRPKPFVENPKFAKKDPYEKEWEKGTWSVEFKQPELQIARSYTPLPPRENDTIGDLRFLIRRETNGEMSRYLAQLPVGGQIELRGPHTELELPKEVTDVVFLAGGTGIAPALQVAHTLLQVRNPKIDLPNIHIIWANRRREDCVGGTDLHGAGGADREEGTIVQELRKLQERYPDNVRADYLVDEEGTFVTERTISDLTKRDSEVKHQAVSSRIDSKLLFVSGPEGFMNYLAGPKKYFGGKEVQGELGGVIGKMGIRDWKAWKQ